MGLQVNLYDIMREPEKLQAYQELLLKELDDLEEQISENSNEYLNLHCKNALWPSEAIKKEMQLLDQRGDELSERHREIVHFMKGIQQKLLFNSRQENTFTLLSAEIRNELPAN